MSLMSTPRGRALLGARKSAPVNSPPTRPNRYLENLRQPKKTTAVSTLGFGALRTPPIERISDAERTQAARDALPITVFKKQILEAVRTNDATIIVAETGAGKSTQVPQFLREAGYSCAVTQPRRLAASSVASWVAKQRGEELGESVSFRHSMGAVEAKDRGLLFTTDGYLLSATLAAGRFAHDVLVLDEMHERNPNMEALLALWKKYRNLGRAPKLVIMSATMDAERLAQYLETDSIVKVPGRTYAVEDLPAGQSVLSDICEQVSLGKNCLVFLPGKNEIAALQAELFTVGLDAEIIPLHGMLTSEEQDRAFKRFDVPKVVLATNVAQTSITIDDIDCVIDLGLERQLHLVEGTESLLIHPISQYDAQQRRGRAGRVRPGSYIYHGPIPLSELPEEPLAPLERVPVDTLMLRLLAGGEHIEALRFYSDIPQQHIEYGKRMLHLLDLTGPQGHITERGRIAAMLPVKARLGKMIVHGLEQFPQHTDLHQAVIALAAICEAQGVTLPGSSKRWRQFCPFECESDHLAQLAVFRAAKELPEELLAESGVDPVSFRRAKQIEELLLKRLDRCSTTEYAESAHGGNAQSTRNDVQINILRQKLLECVWSAHIDAVYEQRMTDNRDSCYRHLIDPQSTPLRKLGRESVVSGDARFIVGRDFDLAVMNERGDIKIVELVLMASRIDIQWAKEQGPAALKKVFSRSTKKQAKSKRREESIAKRNRGDRLPSRARARR